MKHQVYFGIAWRIMALCLLGMIHSYLPDHLREFFGDVYNERYGWWEWGVRHDWYTVMMLMLFILSLVNAIISVRKLVLKHYPDI